MPTREPIEQVIKLTAVDNAGCYLVAKGTVDGVEVTAPFVEMCLDGKPVLEGGVLDLLRQAKEAKDNPRPDSSKAVPSKEPIEPSPPVDYSEREAELVKICAKWQGKIIMEGKVGLS
jgi:hypothetical protein